MPAPGTGRAPERRRLERLLRGSLGAECSAVLTLRTDGGRVLMHRQYDESRQVETDFEDPGEVAAYDVHQGVDDRQNDAILDV
jgi:hypothetical protein